MRKNEQNSLVFINLPIQYFILNCLMLQNPIQTTAIEQNNAMTVNASHRIQISQRTIV